MAQSQAALEAFDGRQTTTFDDKEHRDEEMEEALEEQARELAKAASEARESDRFQEWLDAQAAFHDYSPRNAMLIQLQCPEASRVAGYRTWQNEFDRHVKEGESAIWIWRPNTVTAHKCPECGNAPSYHEWNDDLDCSRAGTDPDKWDIDPTEDWDRGEILCGFSPAPVFDVSQTEGEPLPDLPTEAYGDAEDLLEWTLAAGDVLGYDAEAVPSEDWDRPEGGFCRHDEPPVIRVEHDTDANAVRTLAHEYAHAELHNDRADAPERDARELEAEAAAYIVCRHFALDAGGSSFYLAAWGGDDPEMIEERMGRITSAASHIIEAIEAEDN